jgi:hypothetical protein
MDPKTRGHETKKDRPKTDRPPATAGTPKRNGEREFDPNVNQRPR